MRSVREVKVIAYKFTEPLCKRHEDTVTCMRPHHMAHWRPNHQADMKIVDLKLVIEVCG